MLEKWKRAVHNGQVFGALPTDLLLFVLACWDYHTDCIFITIGLFHYEVTQINVNTYSERAKILGGLHIEENVFAYIKKHGLYFKIREKIKKKHDKGRIFAASSVQLRRNWSTFLLLLKTAQYCSRLNFRRHWPPMLFQYATIFSSKLNYPRHCEYLFRT